MITEIYYFSGTGNSLAIARKINNALTEKGEIKAIPQNLKGVTSNADRVGIVFPVYYHNAPSIVRRFIEGINFEKTPYIFAVANCNTEQGRSLFSIDKILKKKGHSLSAGMVIYMPGNAKINTLDEEEEKLLKSVNRVNEIAGFIETKKNVIEGDNKLGLHLYSRLESYIATNIMFTPKRYKVSDACIDCGICQKVCPVSNITRKDGKPVWKNKCENCLACFHWCPKETISIDNFIIKTRRKYHHLEITLKDMYLR